jgi:hypothetical protein
VADLLDPPSVVPVRGFLIVIDVRPRLALLAVDFVAEPVCFGEFVGDDARRETVPTPFALFSAVS